jgi:hypothetical protein
VLGLHVHLDIAVHGNNATVRIQLELNAGKECRPVVLHCDVEFDVELKTWGSPFSKRHRQMPANGVRTSQENLLEAGRRAPFGSQRVKASQAPSQSRYSKSLTPEDALSNEIL